MNRRNTMQEQIEKVLLNLDDMGGSIEGIAGQDMKELSPPADDKKD